MEGERGKEVKGRDTHIYLCLKRDVKWVDCWMGWDGTGWG